MKPLKGSPKSVAVIGAGPAGLMAAEVLSAAGVSVTVYDRMPSVGRKLLMAGRGGLNLTHSEPLGTFLPRYGPVAGRLEPMLTAFSPADLVAWAEGLGQPTFVGSSGRVFPKAMKASPLLRAWLVRLAAQGVRFGAGHEWLGWNSDGALKFRIGKDETSIQRPNATILALGGASWPRLGSDGGWTTILAERGVAITPLQPANSGFAVAWSDVFRQRFAGAPLKNIRLSFTKGAVLGEAVIAAYGIEGGAVYALSKGLREAIAANGSTRLYIDLKPELKLPQLVARLDRPRGGQSLATFLRKALGFSPLAINLLREAHGVSLPADPAALAAAIKSAPLTLTGVAPIGRAISTAGGVAFSEVDEGLRLRALPDVWVAGEMLDWEAPTGGYLLQASFATGAAAARSVLGAI